MKERQKDRYFLKLLRITKLPWMLLISTCLVSIIHTILNLLLPDISSKLLSGDFSEKTLKTMIWVLVLSAFALAFRQFMMEISRGRITLAFRESVLKKLLSLRAEYYEINPSGTLISRATMDTAMLSDFIVGAFCYIPALLYTFIGSFVIIFTYDWRLVVLEAMLLPILFVITWLNGRLQFKWYNRIQEKLASLSAFLAERLVNIPLMKLFVQENLEEQKGLQAVTELYNSQKKYVFRLSGIQFLVQFETVLQSILVVVGGAVFIRRGYINLQQWIAFYVYSGGLVGSVQQLLDYWQRFKQMTGSTRRISEIAAQDEEGAGGELQMPEERRDIIIKDLSFSYADQTPVLHKLDLSFRANRKTVIIGRSGAGKSTLLYLLERFYMPTSGTIFYGDTDISEYSLDSWRSSIGYVNQNPSLFSGSIRENILYGIHRQVSREELEVALQKAQLWEFISTIHEGLNTQVGENGSKLSGGQRQRVVLARLFLQNPDIILLDEATSGLDVEAKAAIDVCFDELAKNRTVIIVTHDLADCDRADDIVVLENGRLNEQGNRDDVIRHNAIYHYLKYNTQKEGAACENT